MFVKFFSVANLYTLVAICAVLSSAAPFNERPSAITKRDLVPLTPDSQIQPEMVDLLDQYKTLSELALTAEKGTPEYDALIAKTEETKSELEAAIDGVAILVDDETISAVSTEEPTPVATPEATSSDESTTEIATSTDSSENEPSSTITSPTETPTNIPTPDEPEPETSVVTQTGTSVIVVESHSPTSIVIFATSIPEPPSGDAPVPVPSPSSGVTSTIVTSAAPKVTSSVPVKLPGQGTAAKSSQSNIDSGALSVVTPSWQSSFLMIAVSISAIMVL